MEEKEVITNSLIFIEIKIQKTNRHHEQLKRRDFEAQVKKQQEKERLQKQVQMDTLNQEREQLRIDEINYKKQLDDYQNK